MKLELKTVLGDLIFEGDFPSVGELVLAAVAAKKSLSYANLCFADLRSANLSSANLRSANLCFADLRSANLSSADLSSADLRSANLCSADLSSADLSFADLRSASLSSADLSSADLSSADLRSANLSSADLRSANLSSADLSSADLSFADLRSANLSSANLRSANLRSANLCFANLRKLYATRTILPEGDLIGYKKLLGGTICKLRIPAAAKRVGGMVGRKCRAEFAVVLEGEGISQYYSPFTYAIGQTVKPTEAFSEDVTVECAPGIHFFITRQEAEDYSG